MKRKTSARFDHDFDRLPADIQKQVDKQLKLLVQDLRYPSLRTKKYDEGRDIWQARITGDYRVYFQIVGDTYHLIAVVKHPK
jgi:mRNA-degrading endonuclease RelE of RelBE toxin-antitoxin system